MGSCNKTVFISISYILLPNRSKQQLTTTTATRAATRADSRDNQLSQTPVQYFLVSLTYSPVLFVNQCLLQKGTLE